MDRFRQEPAEGPGATTILMIEPDILVRLVIADYLRQCGYVVLEGARARDCHAVLRAGRPVDIALIEVNLPGGIDGFTLATQIRAFYPGIGVVLTTGVPGAADKAAELCDDGPLEKPYHPREAVRRIAVLRARARAGRESPP